MGKYMKLEKMLDDQIQEITERRDLNGASLEVLNKLAHTLKSIKTIEAMEGEYSEDGGYYQDGMSYARGRGRNANRDSREDTLARQETVMARMMGIPKGDTAKE